MSKAQEVLNFRLEKIAVLSPSELDKVWKNLAHLSKMTLGRTKQMGAARGELTKGTVSVKPMIVKPPIKKQAALVEDYRSAYSVRGKKFRRLLNEYYGFPLQEKTAEADMVMTKNYMQMPRSIRNFQYSLQAAQAKADPIKQLSASIMKGTALQKPGLPKKPIVKVGETMTKAEQILEKIAKLTVEDVEDRLGVTLPDKWEQEARRLIAREKGRSVALRHPVLTGIPTLGIWPAIAHAKGKERVSRIMLRQDARLRRESQKAKSITALPNAVSRLADAYRYRRA